MSNIIKSFGFGGASKYTSKTFNTNNNLIFDRNGPISIGSVYNDGLNVVIQDVSFIQNGVIVKRIGSISIGFPNDLPVPFFLIASVPDTNLVDNITWSFINRPQDVSSQMALIAEWDGQEWRNLSQLSIKEIIKDRKDRSLAYSQTGFNSGFRFSANPTFTSIQLSEGLLTDKTGQLVKKTLPKVWTAIDADTSPGFDRIDTILWRRELDSEYRIGSANFFPGPTFVASGFSKLNETLIEGTTQVNSHPKIVVLNDNSYLLFYIEKYGNNGELRALKISSNRTTTLIPSTLLQANVLDFELSKDKNGNVIIIAIQDNKLYKMVVSSNISVLTPFSIVHSTITNVVRKASVISDSVGQNHVVFIYQVGPTTYAPYYVKLNIGGTASAPPKRLITSTNTYSDLSIGVDIDLYLHVAFINGSTGKVEYQTYTEDLIEVGSRTTISDNTRFNLVSLNSSCRKVKVKVASKDVYIFWEQDKGSLNFGLAIYSPKFISKYNYKAIMPEIEGPLENINGYSVDLDWQQHGYFLINNGSLVYFYQFYLPEVNTRMESIFQVSSNPSDHMAIAFDKLGSIAYSWAELQSGTGLNSTPVNNLLIGPGAFGVEGSFLASNELAIALSSYSAFTNKPTIGDYFNVTLSTQGNNGTYRIIDERNVIINSITYKVFKTATAFISREELTPVSAQFLSLLGNNFYVAKQSASLAYGFSEVLAEELESDLTAVLIKKSNNEYQTWYQKSATKIDNNSLRQEFFLACSGEIDWEITLGLGTLSWSSSIHISDPFKSNISIPAGSISGIAENEFLYIKLPKTHFLKVDGFSNIAKIEDVSEFAVGRKVFIGDSNSNGIIATVTAVNLGEVQLSLNIDDFTVVRGAYMVMIEPTVLKSAQNIGDLRPNSLGEVNSDIFLLAYRKDNLIFFRDGALSLESGEVGQIGDGVSENLLDFMGATSESDSTPNYLSDEIITQGSPLTEAISVLDAAVDSILTDTAKEETLTVTNPLGETVFTTTFFFSANNALKDIQVFVNDRRMIQGVNFNKTDDHTITFTESIPLNSLVTIREERTGGSGSGGGGGGSTDLENIDVDMAPDTDGARSIGKSTKAFKALYLKDQVTGNIYRIEMSNGTLQGILI